MVMTELFALDHIPRLMKDLGFGQEYYTEYKHFILRPGDTKSIEAGGVSFIFSRRIFRHHHPVRLRRVRPGRPEP